jgi:hypothetical protein
VPGQRGAGRPTSLLRLQALNPRQQDWPGSLARRQALRSLTRRFDLGTGVLSMIVVDEPRVLGGLPQVVADLGGVLVAAPPGRPAQPVPGVVGGLMIRLASREAISLRVSGIGPEGARIGAWGKFRGNPGAVGKGAPVVSPTRAEGSFAFDLTGLTAAVERPEGPRCRSDIPTDDHLGRTVAARTFGTLCGGCAVVVWQEGCTYLSEDCAAPRRANSITFTIRHRPVPATSGRWSPARRPRSR